MFRVMTSTLMLRFYTIGRQHYVGTWSITRSGIQFIEGSCSGKLLPPVRPLQITQKTLLLPMWYTMTLVKFLGPFTKTRNQSEWDSPYMATGVAAMLWSKTRQLNGAGNLFNANSLPPIPP